MNLKIKELPLSERPYEKLVMYGASKLTNSELLAIIIKSGTQNETSIQIAQKILNLNSTKENNNLRFLVDVSIEELTTIKGVGKIKAIQLKAVSEIAKRISSPMNLLNIVINTPLDIANLLMEEMRYERREIVKLIILNNKNVILKIIDISYGGTNFAVLEPKEVLTDAVKMQAPKIILVHNHPTGDPKPSDGDIRITGRIKEAADILGIELLDHIIIGDGKFRSIIKKG